MVTFDVLIAYTVMIATIVKAFTTSPANDKPLPRSIIAC